VTDYLSTLVYILHPKNITDAEYLFFFKWIIISNIHNLVVECLGTNEHLNTYFDIQAIYSRYLWRFSVSTKIIKNPLVDHSCQTRQMWWLGQWHPVTSCDQVAGYGGDQVATPSSSDTTAGMITLSAEMYGAMWSLICGPNKYIYNIWHMYWVSLKSEKIFIAISAAQIWVATSTIKKTTSGPPSANFWDEPATSHRFLSSFHLVPSAERRAEGSLTGGCRAMSRCPEAKLYATHMRRRANIRWIS